MPKGARFDHEMTDSADGPLTSLQAFGGGADRLQELCRGILEDHDPTGSYPDAPISRGGQRSGGEYDDITPALVGRRAGAQSTQPAGFTVSADAVPDDTTSMPNCWL